MQTISHITDNFLSLQTSYSICRYMYVRYSLKRWLYEHIIIFMCSARETIRKFADKSRWNILTIQHILGFLPDCHAYWNSLLYKPLCWLYQPSYPVTIIHTYVICICILNCVNLTRHKPIDLLYFTNQSLLLYKIPVPIIENSHIEHKNYISEFGFFKRGGFTQNWEIEYTP